MHLRQERETSRCGSVSSSYFVFIINRKKIKINKSGLIATKFDSNWWNDVSRKNRSDGLVYPCWRKKWWCNENGKPIQSVRSKLSLLLPKHNVLFSQCLKQWGAFYVLFFPIEKHIFYGSISKNRLCCEIKQETKTQLNRMLRRCLDAKL